MTRRRVSHVAITGTVAAGKSLTLQILSSQGWRVFSADTAVRDLLHRSADAISAVRTLAPAVVDGERVDRRALRKWIAADPDRLALLERALHPPLRIAMEDFLSQSRRGAGSVCEIPLLFEVDWASLFDHIIVVDAHRVLRRARALRRPGVDAALWSRLTQAQTPAFLKRRLADRVLWSGLGPRALRQALRRALRSRRRRPRLSPRYRHALGDDMMRF